MKKVFIIILASIWLSMLWSVSHADNNITLTPCEIATIEATKIGWQYTITGIGFKAMIVADNATKKICDKSK